MGTAFSTYYISLSIFLGFAISFPDMQVLLYFHYPDQDQMAGVS